MFDARQGGQRGASVIFFWFIIVSYLLGFVFFFLELHHAIKHEKYYIMKAAIIILFLAPLTTWHGVLHYAQWAFCKLTKRPVKYWL